MCREAPDTQIGPPSTLSSDERWKSSLARKGRCCRAARSRYWRATRSLSLASLLGITREQWIEWYGIDLRQIDRKAAETYLEGEADFFDDFDKEYGDFLDKQDTSKIGGFSSQTPLSISAKAPLSKSFSRPCCG